MTAIALVAGTLACTFTLLLVPLVISLCQRWRLLDQPGPLKIHECPVPRLGGVSLVLATTVSVFLAEARTAIHAWPFFVVLWLIWIAGTIDDVRSLSIVFRLAAQMAAGVLLWLGGWQVPTAGSSVVSLIATCIFVISLVNCFNFLDGSDGVAAGVAGIILGAYGVVSASRADAFGTALACATAGACLGFLAYNHAPAKIFLGDGGSTALGLTIAFLGLSFWRGDHATLPHVVFPALVATLPLLDGALAILRRLSFGASPLYGDRHHVYDEMLARGWTPRRVALVCYAITAVFAAIAVWGVRSEAPRFWAVAALAVGLLILFAIGLGTLQTGATSRRRRPEASAGEIRKDITGID